MASTVPGQRFFGGPGRRVDVAWNPPVPRAVARLRADLADRMQSESQLEQLTRCVELGQTVAIPGLGARGTAQELLAEERERLAAAELYFATAEMTQLAVAASCSLPDFALEPEDLPAPGGFMVFASPVHRYEGPLSTPGRVLGVPIVAISWGPYDVVRTQEFKQQGAGVWVTLWAPCGIDLLRALEAAEGQRYTVASRKQWLARQGPLQWDNEAMWPYGRNSAELADRLATGAPMQVLRAAWLLMQQPQLIESSDIERRHSERGHDVRAKLNQSPVRVLQLHKEQHVQAAAAAEASGETPGGEDAAEAGREYTCRWLVAGHWRQQWYPARKVHRPLWIAPHLKGPADKPLRTAETVHLWDR